ncbi:hypothetical protein A1OE_1000 [Candidatus Endolissoclinum faulkneri L2]|uniref:EamA domain-containing protein n=1 Tax=Candidatus Endolissoclinum faulkneri L2 TaxID=1193729 RepID=K7ZD47_9PROT|nr:DMT family transporter [Candidatus Endolissoclinum faulkneri]AFX99181.1 hypothetical protein A1OE_1000 [Candidatus Endolissoclinum faulkneri L2]
MIEVTNFFFDYMQIILAIIASLMFALGAQWQKIGLATVDWSTGAMILITAATCTLWIFAPFFMHWQYWLEPQVLIFALVGLFRPAVSANLAAAGIRYLGPTLGNALASISPLFDTVMGVLILGERFTWSMAIGTIGIMVGILLLSKRGEIKVDWPLWALFLPIGAASLRALGHLLSKVGMESGIPDPYFASIVGFTVSAIITWLVQVLLRDSILIDWKAPGVKWFALGGATTSAGIICLNVGLLRGDLVVLAPMAATSPIFTMLLSVLIFHSERLTNKVVCSTLIVVISVLFIALGN